MSRDRGDRHVPGHVQTVGARRRDRFLLHFHRPRRTDFRRRAGPDGSGGISSVYRDRVGETYSFTYNPKHRWFYFPQMQRNEALLLKCYDSKEDGRARFTAHTSFEDPTSPPDAPPRESIEVRALIFFAPEKKDSDLIAVTGRNASAVAAN